VGSVLVANWGRGRRLMIRMTKASIFLFDLGGVLIENSSFDALQDLLPYTLDKTALKEQWLKSSVVRRFELGELAPDAFAIQFLEEWRISLSPGEFISRFISWPKGFFIGVEALLARLRDQYHVSCLSNSNELHWKKFDALRDHFDSAYSSHLLGKIKPDPDVFITVAQNLGAEPDQVYFFDDSLSNVKSAQTVGMRAFHVDGLDDVVQIIKRENLL
jgi:glucose-1-phosphatase